jgi:hypothetical protein
VECRTVPRNPTTPVTVMRIAATPIPRGRHMRHSPALRRDTTLLRRKRRARALCWRGAQCAPIRCSRLHVESGADCPC